MKFLKFSTFVLFIININAALYAQTIHGVIVLPQQASVPVNARKIGTIKAGNNATKTKCDYEAVINSVKEKAKKMGGNMVKISQLHAPVFISKCYSISADVYYSTDTQAYSDRSVYENSKKNAHHEYATLCIYRLRDTIAFASAYKLHRDNDSIIGTMKSKSWDSLKIYREGPLTLWGETEKRGELKLDIKYGQLYYIRCGLQKGQLRMVPFIELMDNSIGRQEYERLAKKRKGQDVTYLQQIH